MSELKTYKMVDEKYCADCVCVIPSEVYLKSEVDMVIDELKVKLRVQTSNAEDAWKLKDSYHSSYAEAVKELYEKNKELRHHKYKRCLVMAKICEDKLGTVIKPGWWNKWRNRWLKLAEKFKEAK